MPFKKTDDVKWRTCISPDCGKRFRSKGPGYRLCPVCREAWNEFVPTFTPVKIFVRKEIPYE